MGGRGSGRRPQTSEQYWAGVFDHVVEALGHLSRSRLAEAAWALSRALYDAEQAARLKRGSWPRRHGGGRPADCSPDPHQEAILACADVITHHALNDHVETYRACARAYKWANQAVKHARWVAAWKAVAERAAKAG